MMHWFIWKGLNSYNDFGLWISSMPSPRRAAERCETIDIPGRSGSLILLEGDEVYEPYDRDIVVTTRNDNPKLQQMLAWLRDSSDLILSNEPDYAYEGRILNKVAFDRVGNNLVQATIRVFVEPLKKARNKEANITLTASGDIINPGDAASRPIVSITASGTKTIKFGDQQMIFWNLSGTVKVNCDAGIITTVSNNETVLWAEKVSGSFWKIPSGTCHITVPASTTLVIEPQWRWV